MKNENRKRHAHEESGTRAERNIAGGKTKCSDGYTSDTREMMEREEVNLET